MGSKGESKRDRTVGGPLRSLPITISLTAAVAHTGQGTWDMLRFMACTTPVRGRGQLRKVHIGLEKVVEQAAVQPGDDPMAGTAVGLGGDKVQEDMDL